MFFMVTISEAMDIALQHHQAGRFQSAEQIYRQILQADPNHADAWHYLGVMAHQLGKWEMAVDYVRRAIALNGNAFAFHNLGNVLKDQGRLEEAITCYRRALEIKPDVVETYNNLGLALQEQGKLDEAVDCYHHALELQPVSADAHNNLGNAFRYRGKLDEAVACYRRALELNPDFAVAHSNLLLTLHYFPGVTPTGLAEAHAEYERQHAAPLRGLIAPQERAPDRQGRLRLGFVSPDLGRHPVGYFLVRVMEHLKQQGLELICYSNRNGKDDLTQRFQSAATHWRDVAYTSDEQLAEQIRADQIDVLFDLAGHTAKNRLLVFARKPAPVQITWIGYEGATGLAAMDFLLADRHVVPAGAEQYYREQVLRMPDGYLCYEPPQSAPVAGPLPSLQRGYATFGSFNNLAKITPEVVAVWAAILRRASTARLVLKYRGLEDQSVRRRYLDLFAAHDVGAERLELLPWTSYQEYLATYQQVDLALDPFPFSGSATTCDALWMGVPVVTCPGTTFASRHSLSHLTNVGLTETIAGTFDEYVELAVRLAGDLPRLAGIRARLREQMLASPLCDGRRFAANLMRVLREACERLSWNVFPAALKNLDSPDAHS
jgi:protein O-GlcNAc transferase